MRVSQTSFFAASLFIAALAGACTQQGEGLVCDPRAGNGGSADCQDGLVCTQPSDLAPGTMGYRCCPGDPALATGVCARGTSMVPENSAVPDAEAEGGAPEGDAGDAANGDATLSADATGADALADASGEAGEAGDAGGIDP